MYSDSQAIFVGTSHSHNMYEAGYHDRLCGLDPQQPDNRDYMDGYVDRVCIEISEE